MNIYYIALKNSFTKIDIQFWRGECEINTVKKNSLKNEIAIHKTCSHSRHHEFIK